MGEWQEKTSNRRLRYFCLKTVENKLLYHYKQQKKQVQLGRAHVALCWQRITLLNNSIYLRKRLRTTQTTDLGHFIYLKNPDFKHSCYNRNVRAERMKEYLVGISGVFIFTQLLAHSSYILEFLHDWSLIWLHHVLYKPLFFRKKKTTTTTKTKPTHTKKPHNLGISG